MSTAPPMRQRHYNELIRGLDIAMKVFLELCPTEGAAHDALKSFVETHYLPVWRAIESDTDTSTI